MSIRAFAAHLGVAMASVTNWERRGELARLRHETQQILDADLRCAPDYVVERFEAALASFATPTPSKTSDDVERLAHVLAHPGTTDLATAWYLRTQVTDLDAAYDHVPSASLLGAAAERHGKIAFLHAHATARQAQREMVAAFAESAILMGQLLWDASLRREHAFALSYFDSAEETAAECGNWLLAARAQLRRSLVALYGYKDATAGLVMAAQAARTSRAVSNALAGLALLHVAEAHAMCGQRRSCEGALSAAETHIEDVRTDDPAVPLLAPFDLNRMAGSCYLRLGDANRAAIFLDDTVQQAGQTKAAAVAAANLALAFTQQHKIDEAVTSLHQAIDITDATRGSGGLTVAFAAGKALAPWRDDPAVREVHDRLLTLMTS
jgi:tetratricopeptide (TPR) repeat protein